MSTLNRCFNKVLSKNNTYIKPELYLLSTSSVRPATNNASRTYTGKSPKYEEISIPVPWGEVKGKWWGTKDKIPILTTHGWQDSCSSFDRLIPLLDEKYSFLTIDWPGHGLSSRLPNGMYYFFYNYILTLKHVITYFNWKKVSLLGHSLGGITSLVYSIFYPNTVNFVICCEINITFNEMLEWRTKAPMFLDIFPKYSKQAEDFNEPPSYTLEEIKKKRSDFSINNPLALDYEYVQYVIDRNISPSKKYPGKFYFSRDPRVKLDGILPFTTEDFFGFADIINHPVLAIKARQSTYNAREVFEPFVNKIQNHNKQFKYVKVEGKHHVHLINPEHVAGIINEFIREYNTEIVDRKEDEET